MCLGEAIESWLQVDLQKRVFGYREGDEDTGHREGFKAVDFLFPGSLQAKDTRDGVMIKDVGFGVRGPAPLIQQLCISRQVT